VSGKASSTITGPMPASYHPVSHHSSDDTPMPTEYPPSLAYQAWSERGRRWVAMTFNEHQAWLTRPDLDPVEFAPGEVAS